MNKPSSTPQQSMKDKFIEWCVILFCLSVIALPFLYAYAVISTCGWMGFFIECRIMGSK